MSKKIEIESVKKNADVISLEIYKMLQEDPKICIAMMAGYKATFTFTCEDGTKNGHLDVELKLPEGKKGLALKDLFKKF